MLIFSLSGKTKPHAKDKFFFLLVLANPLFSQSQYPVQPVSYTDFSGGINDTDSPLLLQPNESQSIDNFYIDETPGALVTRRGFQRCGNLPSGNVGTGIWTYTSDAGTSTIIVTDNQNFYSTSDCQTFTTLVTGYDSTAKPDCEMVYNDLWCSNGVNNVFKTNASSSFTLTFVPKCEFLEFEQDTVWCGRTTANKSSVFFSNRTEPLNGQIIEPSSSSAWPVNNELRLAENDGSGLRGLKKYLGTVVACKDDSLWVLNGNDEFDFEFKRMVNNVGCFNDTMVESNGILYLLGKQGIYKFDARTAVRISDKTKGIFSSIQVPSTNRFTHEWTSQSDFDAGTKNNIQTSNPSGSIRIFEDVNIDSFTDANFTANPAWTVFPSTGVSISSGGVYAGDNSIRLSSGSGLSSQDSYIYTAQTLSTGTWEFDFESVQCSPAAGTGDFPRGSYVNFILNSATPGSSFDGYSLYWACGDSKLIFARIDNGVYTIIGTTGTVAYHGLGSRYSFKITRDKSGNMKAYVADVLKAEATDTTYSVTNFLYLRERFESGVFDNILIPTGTITGIFTSDIFDAGSAITSWGVFSTDEQTNSQGLTHQVRVGLSEANIVLNSFVNISPGAQISTRTDVARYVQWRSTFTSDDGVQSALVNSVETAWNQGGSGSIGPYAYLINDRYWLSIATGSLSEKQGVLVKSANEDAFTLFSGLTKYNAFTKYNDAWYAVDSSTPQIHRVDYSDTDNGTGIVSNWQSRDEVWSAPFNLKRLREVQVDYLGASTARNLTLSYSNDSGNSFTSIATQDLTGTGRLLKRFYDNSFGMQYRFRLSSSDSGKPVTIYGLYPISILDKLRE